MVQMEETAVVEGYLKDLLNVMATRAEKEVDAILPGYTHLQVSCPLSQLLLSLIYSAPNLFDGPTTSSPTPKPSSPTFRAYANSTLESPSSLSVRPHSPETLTLSTASFCAPN